jgi:hypothetical protein
MLVFIYAELRDHGEEDFAIKLLAERLGISGV